MIPAFGSYVSEMTLMGRKQINKYIHTYITLYHVPETYAGLLRLVKGKNVSGRRDSNAKRLEYKVEERNLGRCVVLVTVFWR